MSFNKMSEQRIFCDLDGVLADFDTALSIKCKKISPGQRATTPLNEELVWKLLSKYPDIFADFPLMNEAIYLWSSLLPYKPIILSGCPRSKISKESKVKWCNKYLGSNYLQVNTLKEIDANPNYDYYIILTSTKKKPDFATNGSILIDDRLIIDKQWEDRGGIFLHYNGSNAEEIVKTLKKWTI